MREKRGDAADRAGLAVDVEHRHVALGRGVELEDPRNAEATLEGLPDVGGEPVAAAEPDPVRRLGRRRLGVQEVSAELTDVLKERAVPADHVAPEVAGRESFAEHHGRAADEGGAGRHDAADAVVHRQAVVHPVRRPNVHQPREPVTPLHQAKVADPRGLGQPGRARRIDVERPIVERRRPAPRPLERLAAVPLDVAIDAREVVVPGAVNPDRGSRAESAQRRREAVDQHARDDDMARRDELEAVGEGGADQMRVQQRDHAADARDAEPRGEVLRPIGHVERDGLADADAARERPARIAVRALGQRPVAQALALGQQRRRRAARRGELVDDRRQDPMRRRRDRCRQLERAQPGPAALGRSRHRLGGLHRPRLTRRMPRNHAVLPASTVSTVPVMLVPPSPSRNSTARATSSTSGRR